MIVLVTGGAGYIGSHVCKALAKAGHVPVVYDNFCNGHQSLIKWGAHEEGDVRDAARLKHVMAAHKIDAVIHMAAHIAAGESVENPGKYYHNNTYGSLVLLEAMREMGISYFVLSSTAAVYGNPVTLPITEEHPLAPINAYGASKLMVEQMLSSYAMVERGKISSVALRYFNAAGADPEGEAGCLHIVPQNLIPIILEVLLKKRECLPLYGTDYDTPDGTAIRDYIHVSDLAHAHVLALQYLVKKGESTVMNLGTGHGHSVREVIAAAEKVSGKKVAVRQEPRRAGDPPSLAANSTKAARLLGWKPEYADLEKILRTAWEWTARA